MNTESKNMLHDRICYVILKAPDRFPSDIGMNLDKAFSEMNKNLKLCFDTGSKEFQCIARLLKDAYASYINSNQKQAIRSLQTIEGFLAGRVKELPINS